MPSVGRRLFPARPLGVTIVEILVALGILTIILAPTFQAFVLTTRSVTITGDSTIAVYLSQKIIEDIRYNKYNEDTKDFPKFLRNCLEGDKAIFGSNGSKYFREVFNDQNSDDRFFLKEMEKFGIDISYDNYSVPPDPTDAQVQSGASIDVDGDGLKDPDASQINVNVKWEQQEENGRKEYQSRFATILSRGQVHD